MVGQTRGRSPSLTPSQPGVPSGTETTGALPRWRSRHLVGALCVWFLFYFIHIHIYIYAFYSLLTTIMTCCSEKTKRPGLCWARRSIYRQRNEWMTIVWFKNNVGVFTYEQQDVGFYWCGSLKRPFLSTELLFHLVSFFCSGYFLLKLSFPLHFFLKLW